MTAQVAASLASTVSPTLQVASTRELEMRLRQKHRSTSLLALVCHLLLPNAHSLLLACLKAPGFVSVMLARLNFVARSVSPETPA